MFHWMASGALIGGLFELPRGGRGHEVGPIGLIVLVLGDCVRGVLVLVSSG